MKKILTSEQNSTSSLDNTTKEENKTNSTSNSTSEKSEDQVPKTENDASSLLKEEMK